MPAVIRSASAADAKLMAQLRRDMFAELGQVGPTEDWVSAAQEWFYDHLADLDVHAVLVEDDARVVSVGLGVVQGLPPTPGFPHMVSASISNMYTVPEFRRRGYGRQVLDRLVQWARKREATRVDLFASSAGRSLYEGFGFSVHDFPHMRMPLGAVTADAEDL